MIRDAGSPTTPSSVWRLPRPFSEDAVRNAISLGGDSDTLACITGGIAEAFYQGVPEVIEQEVLKRLTPDLFQIVEDFRRTFPKPRKSA